MSASEVTSDLLVARAFASDAPPVCVAPEPQQGLRAQAARLQKLVEQVQSLPDPVSRQVASECIESLLAVYGEGLGRVLEILREHQTDRPGVLDALTHDPTISGLLLIHGLHPLDLPTRLQQALDKVRPLMESHGGNVELLELHDGLARLRLKGSCQSCPSSRVTLELAVRSALEEACPDLAGFEVESPE